MATITTREDVLGTGKERRFYSLGGSKQTPDYTEVNMQKYILWLLICLALITRMAGAGAAYYVITNGNDANPGTSLAAAKKTIQAAVDLAADGDTAFC